MEVQLGTPSIPLLILSLSLNLRAMGNGTIKTFELATRGQYGAVRIASALSMLLKHGTLMSLQSLFVDGTVKLRLLAALLFAMGVG